MKQERVIPLAKKLITIPSVEGNLRAMRETLNTAKKQLREFSCEEFYCAGTESVLFFNIPVRPEKFRVLLLGHLDVVPGNKEQFKPIERRGKLYGRGSWDMKSACAGFIEIFRTTAPFLPFAIGLALVTDEEDGGYKGAKYMIEQDVRANFVICGEPTNFTICTEHKGSLAYVTDFQGVSAHGAYPQLGINALVQAAEFIVNLEKRYPDPKNGEWVTTVNPSMIRTTNQVNNVIPADATVFFGIRYVSEDNADRLEEDIRAMLPQGATLRRIGHGIPSYTDQNFPDVQLLTKVIQDQTGQNAKFSQEPGGSDTKYFSAAGSAVIDFGPIGKGLHTDEEYVEIKSLKQYVSILKLFLLSLK
jgi:succinyl-diaminopimelate desuccinylase